MRTRSSRWPLVVSLAACNCVVLFSAAVTIAVADPITTTVVVQTEANSSGSYLPSPETAPPSTTASGDSTAIDSLAGEAATNSSTKTQTSTARQSSRSPSTSSPNAGGPTGAAAAEAPSRITPVAGAYDAAVRGTASINGRRQSVPQTGRVTLSDIDLTALLLKLPSGPANVELVQRWSGPGSDLVSLRFTADDVTKTVQVSPAPAWIRFGAPVGSSWSWSARTTDDKTTVQARSTVLPGESVTVTGVAIPVQVFETVLTLGGDMSGTATIVSSVAPDSRLPIRQRQMISARASVRGFSVPITSDITVTLIDLDPRS